VKTRYENRAEDRPPNADDLLLLAADKAFHNWITKYEFYALGVEPLILQRGPRPLTVGHNALIQTKGYSQRWMTETSYPTTKRSLGDAVRAFGWYRQFREIVLLFAIINIQKLCEPLQPSFSSYSTEQEILNIEHPQFPASTPYSNN